MVNKAFTIARLGSSITSALSTWPTAHNAKETGMARASKAKSAHELSQRVKEATEAATENVLRLAAEARNGADNAGKADITGACSPCLLMTQIGSRRRSQNEAHPSDPNNACSSPHFPIEHRLLSTAPVDPKYGYNHRLNRVGLKLK